MDSKTARKPYVFDRLGRKPAHNKPVCIFWRNGKCLRNPCRFLHSELPVMCAKKGSNTESSNQQDLPTKNSNYIRTKNKLILKRSLETTVENSREDAGSKDCKRGTSKNLALKNEESGSNSTEDVLTKSEDVLTKSEDVLKKSEDVLEQNVCQYWVHGNCIDGDKCQSLHSWFHADGLSILARLQGHTKAVTGIALPEKNNKLYTGSSDRTVRIWDCHTGQCAQVVELGADIGSMISEAVWVFIGMPNVIKALNTELGAEYDLSGPIGQVYAMATTHDITLFAGGQDGVILAWKCTSETNSPFQPVASLKGHTSDVVALTVGRERLYSGSKDHTIRVWDHKTLECVMTLDGHADTVTSLICWEDFLLSGSLDRTVKAWAMNEEGRVEAIYTHVEEHGVVAFCGIEDGNGKPTLYCSCNNNSVQLYEMPSFGDGGRLFAKQEVKVILQGPKGLGLFFTGDQTGLVTAWRWLPKSKE
ncbi:zinc finger CCCH domain-containing protein 48-like [Corylus avellana]|uniref:zinc finger CCCH domain-containing protein 48-like n=1 Tax=Corylus avellana TaxID=13451 RepID=UPI001E214C17|nr:zinc finger CCCH domain-containing protein 48-like [Corylus avellana]